MSVSSDAGNPSRLSVVVEPDYERNILAVHVANDWPRQAGTVMATLWLDRDQAAVLAATINTTLRNWQGGSR